MILYDGARLTALTVHQIGSKALEEPCQYSSSLTELKDDLIQERLLKYFLGCFTQPEFYSFKQDSSPLDENEVFKSAGELFTVPDTLIPLSAQLASRLFDFSTQNNIKQGFFISVLFEGIVMEDEPYKGIGFYKLESLEFFLQPAVKGKHGRLDTAFGFLWDKPDKGCLILDTLKEEGYKVLAFDRGARSDGHSYWRDEFLRLKTFEDGFHHTRNFLTLARSFVSDVLPEEFEVTRTDQIDYLNRSIGYFKSNEQFNEDEFKKDVFNSPEVISSFNEYKKTYEDAADFTLSSEFEISGPAVKKQARVFKSVLKLDRNFHIYVHGNRELIEKGMEADGRKFYKIYYEEEN